MFDLSLWLDGLCLFGQALMHILFTGRLTGKKPGLWHFAVYLLLLCAIEVLSRKFISGSGMIAIGAGILALYAMSRFGLGNQRPVSWLAAVLAFYISQLSFGILNSLESVLFPRVVGSPLLYLLLSAALAAFFLLCACCYASAIKLLSWTEDSPAPYIGLLLLPGLFFFAAEWYVLQTAYGFLDLTVSRERFWQHIALLLLQVMGLSAMLCTLYAYRHLCQGFRAEASLQALGQAARAQKVYIAEAQARYAQTQAFRHDIKNHLCVLQGLLDSGKWQEGRRYLGRLAAVSGSLCFHYQTGNPVVDILLEEKLGLAREITAQVSLLLPGPCGIDDFDLCVIFANALDNAITACRLGGGDKAIRIGGQRQGGFYMLSFENTCPDTPLPPAGIGLANIRSVAEKYHGAVLTEKSGGRFHLNVLLNISHQP